LQKNEILSVAIFSLANQEIKRSFWQYRHFYQTLQSARSYSR
jgi:hypothetical protein